MRTDLVLDALEMAVWQRDERLDGLICHSDAGSQYKSLRYTERLAEIGAAPSVSQAPVMSGRSEAETGVDRGEAVVAVEGAMAAHGDRPVGLSLRRGTGSTSREFVKSCGSAASPGLLPDNSRSRIDYRRTGGR